MAKQVRSVAILSVASTVLSVVAGLSQPTPVQLAWQNNQGAIIHYNMATMVGSQGCNRGNWAQASDPRLFNPNAALDTDSWGRAMQAANISYAVYVAKHNCGFTTFPTKATLPDGSPYNYSIQYSSSPDLDVVASFLATCKKYNIHPGFYYSISTNTYLNVDGRVVQPGPLLPGQVNVTQQQFYDIALFQLRELWDTYGANGTLFEVWFDGGLPNDSVFGQQITALLNKYQPNAAAFNGWPYIANDVRWIGTEDGAAPDPNWSTGSCNQGLPNPVPPPDGGDPKSTDWCPAEVDSTMQQNDNWFYIPEYPVHPLSDLVNTYHASLGRNANWILDIAPAPNSSVAASHMVQYEALGNWIRGCYDAPIATAAMPAGKRQFTLVVPSSTSINRIRLVEDQSNGQLVHQYIVEAAQPGEAWGWLSNGTSIGAGKIDLFNTSATTSAIRVTTDSAPAGLVASVYSCVDPQ